MTDAGKGPEPLRRQIARVKARWLQRVMYSWARPTEKNFAFVIFDHLNCVTLDAWPSQHTMAERLRCSTKTIKRAAEGLERCLLISVAECGRSHRYAPIFNNDDWDIDGQLDGQVCRRVTDENVYQSSSSIHSKSTSIGGRWTERPIGRASKYKAAERGRWETQLAARCGSDGLDILSRLSAIDDGIVENLCRAFCDGELDEQEFETAKLAAKQSSISRGIR